MCLGPLKCILIWRERFNASNRPESNMNHPYRKQFSFFAQAQAPVYLDSAATTQKLDKVLDCADSFNRFSNASVHRSAYALANNATTSFEEARSAIARFINAKHSSEVVFTSGATESLNLIAQGMTKDMLSGDTILLCQSEHHANILPWQALAKRLNLKIEVLALDKNGIFSEQTLKHWLNAFKRNIALFACAHASNVLGNIYPVDRLCEQARAVDAISVIDGTQAVAHLAVDVQAISCDFYVFSGHKMYANTGIGVCWGRLAHLVAMQASKLGGEMVTAVSFTDFKTQEPPLKFEAGTPNIAGVLGLHQAVLFLQDNLSNIGALEGDLYQHLLEQMREIKAVVLLGNLSDNTSISVLSFYAPNLDNHSLAMGLYQRNIALRFGQHCAMPLLESLGVSACLRVSLACYNNIDDVNFFINALKQNIETLQQALTGEEIEAKALIHAQPHNSGQWESNFKEAHNWPEKHRQLLLLSKSLPMLAPQNRQSHNAVAGCESNVWLEFDAHSTQFRAYSDSKVIRGILAVLILKYHQLAQCESARFAANFEYAKFLKELGLTDYFSSGRKDGVRAVIKRMQESS